MPKTAYTRRAALALTLAAALPSAWAQTPAWPTKPLRIIVGFPAGSSPDLTARTFSEPLAAALGQPVVIENKVGAGGNIGADAVAKAKDGHTIGLFINGNMTIAKLLNPKLPYDPLESFSPIGVIGTTPLAVMATKNEPSNDVRSLIENIRNAPEKYAYGSHGNGTPVHFAAEMLWWWQSARTARLVKPAGNWWMTKELC